MTETMTIHNGDIGVITAGELLAGRHPKPKPPKPKVISKHVVKRLAAAEKRIVDMGGNAVIGPAPQGKASG